MSLIYSKSNGTSGGANQPPVEFLVDGPGTYDPASGQPVYNNPLLVGKKYSFFLSGQYQDTSTWQKTATGMQLLAGQNFQPGQNGSFIFF